MKKIVLFVLFLTIPLLLCAGDYTFIGISNANTDLISGTQVAETWLDISGLTEHAASGFTTTSGTTVTSTNGGTYLVKYSVSFDATASCNWTIAVDVNGTNYHEIIRRIGSPSDVGNASGSGLLVLSAGNPVKLKVSPSVNATEFIPVDVQLVLVEVKESITAPYYASMSINSIVSSFSVGATYTTFTQLTQRDVSSGWSATDGVMICGEGAAGTYLAIFSFSGDAQTAVVTDIGISLNNVAPSTILTKRVFDKTSDIGNVSGCGIVTIENESTIRLMGKAFSKKDFDIYFANVTLVKIVDDQDAPYASMNIELTTSAFTVNTTWTKVTNGLADDVTNGTFWSFSDNSLKPVGVSGGYYLVNYYYSITGGSGDAATIIVDGDIGVKSNTEQLDLAIKRKLDKKDGVDIAAAAGTGIIFIDEAADDITMLLRTPGRADSLRIRKANLSIVRVEKVGDATLPVELSAFICQYLNNTPTIYWVTQSETDNIGWYIYRNNEEDFENAQRITNELIDGYGTTTEQHSYLYEDNELIANSGDVYWYWLQNIDYGGKINTYEPKKLIIPNIEPEHYEPEIPIEYGLHQNNPNPFNPKEAQVEFSFNLHRKSKVELNIYNIKGELIKVLYDGYSSSEEMKWNGKDISGKIPSNGIYLYALIVNGKLYQTKKLILMR